MTILAVIGGLLLIAVVLTDAFVTIVLPRRVNERFRPSRLTVLAMWRFWKWLAQRLPGSEPGQETGRRDQFLGVFGPLALFAFVGLWAAGLVLGFAFLYWGTRVPLGGATGHGSFGDDLYLSGITFFTVGFGDVVPVNTVGRAIAMLEGATGFSFLAVMVSYLPTIFAASTQREAAITLLDARAGSPPSAAEYLRRLAPNIGALEVELREWEEWSAALLENLLSYPILAFFRSQHERQSWLATLTLILDVSSLVLVGIGSPGITLPRRQARLTFAMARHAIGDLSQVLATSPHPPEPDRLTADELARLRAILAKAGLPLASGPQSERQLTELRALYEPYADALADRTLLALPSWLPEPDAVDDWETTAWQYDPSLARRAVDPGAEASG